jgi:hypothetical protein
MSDDQAPKDVESPHIEADVEVEKAEKEEVKKMPARGKMSDTKLANLAKARQVKKEKRLNQYPKGEKRDAAEEKFEAKVREEAEKRAQLLAKEIREKEIMEAELAEFKAWKARGQATEEADAPPKSKKKAGPSASAAKKPSTKPPPKKPKAVTNTKQKRRQSPEQYEDSDQEQSYLTRSYAPRGHESIVDSLLD